MVLRSVCLDSVSVVGVLARVGPGMDIGPTVGMGTDRAGSAGAVLERK